MDLGEHSNRNPGSRLVDEWNMPPGVEFVENFENGHGRQK
jgi:hypothetical protein